MFEKIICILAGIDCNKVSPIKYEKLLRFPAQALDDKIDDINYKFTSILIVVTTIFSIFSILISGWFLLLNLVFIFFWSSWYIKEVRSYKLGRDGEKAMAQYLHMIAREGKNIYIYHDIVRENRYNIDHIVLSKQGIFIIDTKTYSKQKKAKNKISSYGKNLYRNNYKIDGDLIYQIKGQAKWLNEQIEKELNKTYEIRCTIAFIGWYVDIKLIDGVYLRNAKDIKNILVNSNSKENFDDNEFDKIRGVLHKLASQSKSSKSLCC